MTLPEFLRSDAYGEIFLVGHRITLYHLIRRYAEGCSAECLQVEFPTLSPALIDKVIDYYHGNKLEVDEYLKETRQEIQSKAATLPPGPDLGELKRRLETQRQSESA